MSYALVGPFTFDPKTVTACGRAALASVGGSIRQGEGESLLQEEAKGIDPGLYIVLQHDGEGGSPVIAGFWVVNGTDYLAHGPPGPPDRVPPFALALLDAATEEVWWRNLPVNIGSDKAWRPLVVLEWPPYVANRSSLPPPGVPFEYDAPDVGPFEERETWLEAVESDYEPPQSEIPSAVMRDPDHYSDLTAQRSVISVVRGTLKHDGRLHTGSFFMVPPEIYEDGSRKTVPLDEWLSGAQDLREADIDAIEREDDEGHRLGRPLVLFADRIGFHASGWLTKNLGVWPARPDDVAIGFLTDRVVQAKWVGQAYLAVSSTAVVLATVLGFSSLVQWLAIPVPQPLTPPPPPAAQPAMSICSADYPEYVEEFRCQIMKMAESGEPDGGRFAVCGDRSSSGSKATEGLDLQPAFCGLLDRQDDGWVASLGMGDTSNFAYFAASQACFNVLGYPYPYTLRKNGERLLGNPAQFLKDEALGIKPLMDLVGELEQACETYTERLENKVQGAVFATHIGTPLGEAGEEEKTSELRRFMFGQAMVGVGSEAQQCFRVGMNDGLSATHYQAMCGDEPDRFDLKTNRSKMWKKLAGKVPDSGAVTLADRYMGSRFASPNTNVNDLWSCHLGLSRPGPVVLGSRRGFWEMPIPLPDVYNTRGIGAKRQLELDATLRAIDGGTDAGVCWRVVSKRLSAYAPVHPLLGELDEAGWPSPQQQLCGQICASRFKVRYSFNDSAWVTRQEDLDMCVLANAGPESDQGRGTLDRLRIPWSYERRGQWVTPTQAQVCAFNMVAQELLPAVTESYIVGGRSPKEWSGETASGSRIVGGEKGLAVRYVKGLAFGKRETISSVQACGHIATQCFTSAMLETTGNDEIERYQWKQMWERRILGMADEKRSVLLAKDPWCAGIKDYLLPERETAQFDTPCVAGVEEARKNVEAVLVNLENDISLGGF